MIAISVELFTPRSDKIVFHVHLNPHFFLS